MDLDTRRCKGRGRHKDGKLVRVSPESARNARPKKMYITHGRSALRHAAIDRRTSLGRRYKAGLAELKAHLGPEISIPQMKLADQAVRLSLLADIAWAEVMQLPGLVQNGGTPPAIDIFLRCIKTQKDLLILLGLERHAKPADLQAYIQGKVIHESA